MVSRYQHLLLMLLAPTEQYAESTKDTFFNTLQKAVQKVKKEHPSFNVLIGADMDATGHGHDSFGSWSHIGPNNDDLLTNDNGTRLLSFSDECKLFILNSFFQSSKIHRHTWYSPTGFTKRVIIFLQNGISKSFCARHFQGNPKIRIFVNNGTWPVTRYIVRINE